jgi:mono/diheme cytochrome c family protein
VKKSAIGCFLLIGSLAAVGCDDPPGKPKPGDSPIAANKVVDFDTLYSKNCAGCHGAEGENGPAPPLNDPYFLSIVPDETLLTIIKSGRKVHTGQKTSMPAFASDNGGPLTNEQVKVLAKGIKIRWTGRAPRESTLPSYLAEKKGDHKEGERVFTAACAGCHGSKGEGKASDGMAGALNDQAFLGLISDQALRRIVITGRHDLGMPAYDDSKGRSAEWKPLTSGQIDDLVALLASWRKPGTVIKKK